MRRAVFLVSTLFTGCLLNPNQGEPLCGASATINFYGYSTVANNVVSIQAARSRTGTFSTFATAISGAHPIHYAGYNLYYYSVQATIPTWESTGSTLKSYARARAVVSGHTVTFSTFDQ